MRLPTKSNPGKNVGQEAGRRVNELSHRETCHEKMHGMRNPHRAEYSGMACLWGLRWGERQRGIMLRNYGGGQSLDIDGKGQDEVE